jgi:hypothetical protein
MAFNCLLIKLYTRRPSDKSSCTLEDFFINVVGKMQVLGFIESGRTYLLGLLGCDNGVPLGARRIKQ